MTNLHLTDEQIAISAEALNKHSFDSLSPDVKEHMQECDECSHYVLAVSETLQDLSDNETVKSDHHISFTKKALALAASLAIMVSVSFYFYSIIKPNHFLIGINDQNSISQENCIIGNDKESSGLPCQPITQQQAKDKRTRQFEKLDQSNSSAHQLLAYAPSKQLNTLCERFIDAALRNADVKVESLHHIKSRSNQVELKWSKNNNQVLIVEVYNNTGEVIGEYVTNNSSIKPNCLTKPGLYYWKLLSEDFDLLFCGKISIH